VKVDLRQSPETASWRCWIALIQNQPAGETTVAAICFVSNNLLGCSANRLKTQLIYVYPGSATKFGNLRRLAFPRSETGEFSEHLRSLKVEPVFLPLDRFLEHFWHTFGTPTEHSYWERQYTDSDAHRCWGTNFAPPLDHVTLPWLHEVQGSSNWRSSASSATNARTLSRSSSSILALSFSATFHFVVLRKTD
jgi:hypothetical protein